MFNIAINTQLNQPEAPERIIELMPYGKHLGGIPRGVAKVTYIKMLL